MARFVADVHGAAVAASRVVALLYGARWQ